jgi:triosephosphate isomerase
MLADVGCTYVIIGHSERRHGLDENDAVINYKVQTALAAGLTVILCVGERRDERKDNRMEQVFYRQVAAGLAGLDRKSLDRLVIAYEPVWAIGTGDVATPQQAQDAHAFIRSHITSSFGKDLGERIPILYGGSMKADNAAGLLSQPDIDGGLIGGASLVAKDFLGIARAAVSA